MSKDWKAEAKKWLEFLRNGTSEYGPFTDYLRRDLQDGGLSLADIGTSEEEIEELRIKGCKTNAKRWLKYLRDGTSMNESFVGYLRRDIEKGGLSLADIGTSEEELERLRNTKK